MNRFNGVDVLVVEDNPDHAEFTLKALADADGRTRTHWVKDGAEALDFLHRRDRWSDTETAPRPGLILLDINMPRVNGHEVLREVKRDDALRSIPVVMLTTSDREDEIRASYQAGANSFVMKRVKFKEFRDQIKALKEYWTVTSRLPAAV